MSWTERPCGVRRAADRERHDAAAVEEQQPADRPAEQQLAACRRPASRPSASASGTPGRAARRSAARAARRPRSCRAGAADTRGTRPSASATRVELLERRRPACARSRRAAGVGWPSASNAAETGGPVTTSSRSSCRSAMRAIRTVSRRGVLKVSIGALGRAAATRPAAPSTRSPSCRFRPGSQLAGNSSSRSRSAVLDPCAHGRSTLALAALRPTPAPCAIATASCRTRRM